MPDLLDLTARQVRNVRGPIHKLDQAEQRPSGRVYTTRCGAVMSNVGGAVLTTNHATCILCAPTGKGNASQAPGSLGRTGQGVP